MCTLSISSKILAERVNNVSKAMTTRAAVKLDECIRIRVQGTNVRIAAYDESQLWISTSIEAVSCNKDFTAFVNAKELADALTDLKEQIIDLVLHDEDEEDESKRGTISIVYSGGEIVVAEKGQNTESEEAVDFAFPPKCEYESEIAFVGSSFRGDLSRCASSMSNDELRPLMNGTCILAKAEDKSVDIVATDGRRLVVSRSEYSGEKDFYVVLPKRVCRLLSSLPYEDIVLLVDNGQEWVKIKAGEYTIIARTIGGKYPLYNAVIPKDNDKFITADRKMLVSSVKRAMRFGNKSSKLVKFTARGGKLDIEAEDADLFQKFRQTISCENTSAEEKVMFGLSGDMLTDMLSNIDGEDVTIELLDETRPVLISSAKEKGVIRLLMPMRIENAENKQA